MSIQNNNIDTNNGMESANAVAQRKLRKAETLEYQPSKLNVSHNKPIARNYDNSKAKDIVDKTFQEIELLQKELGSDNQIRRATVTDGKRATMQH